MILTGDCRDVLPTLGAESVQCCVTSPPYWGLRDYGVEGQLGLEPTPEEYVANMVAVFRDARRVLRPDGVLWLNLGDSYAGSGKGPSNNAKQASNAGADGGLMDARRNGAQFAKGQAPKEWIPIPRGLKSKDLVGIPWRVAFALQADGWYLRSDIIWSKPNPMPESVTDRPTKSHEYLFLLTKSERYFYDADAIAEPATHAGRVVKATGGSAKNAQMGQFGQTRTGFTGRDNPVGDTRNARTVWTIPTRPFPDAHFAVFPPELARRCILAGTSERGCCPECGAPWERLVERVDQGYDGSKYGERAVEATGGAKTGGTARSTLGSSNGKLTGKTTTTGWRPTCDHDAEPIPCTVLDPFSGAGTTGYVAQEHGRGFVGIELNPEYVRIAEKRTAQQTIWTEPAA